MQKNMKSQQVNVNIPLMIETAFIYLGLALSGWMLLRLLQACVWLPSYLNSQEGDAAASLCLDNASSRRDENQVLNYPEPYFSNTFHLNLFTQMSLEHGLEKSDELHCRAPISRIRVEKIEGGLVVAGVVIAANCQVALPIFGCLFILVGIVLTVASYRGPGQDEAPENYAARLAFTGNSRILGPACIVVGFVMLSAGIALCFLTRKARRREKRVGFHCPIHGDFYPLSPVTASKALGKYEAGWGLCFGRARNLGMDRMPQTPPQCPHTQMSSTRSSFSSVPVSPCPTPVPFLFASNSISSDLAISVGANVSPDQTFGSIRSLSVSREVASFPLSRTPSPPSPRDRSHHRSDSVKRSSKIFQKDDRNLEVADTIKGFNFGKKTNINYYKAEKEEYVDTSSKFPDTDTTPTETLLASSPETDYSEKNHPETWVPESIKKDISSDVTEENND